jgi:hypothetical protein
MRAATVTLQLRSEGAYAPYRAYQKYKAALYCAAPAYQSRRTTDYAQVRHGAPLPEEIVDDVDKITGHLRRMDDRVGGGSLLALVGEQLRHVTGLIENRRYDESLGRRLHSSAAGLLRLAGWLSFDSGRSTYAQHHCMSQNDRRHLRNALRQSNLRR